MIVDFFHLFLKLIYMCICILNNFIKVSLATWSLLLLNLGFVFNSLLCILKWLEKDLGCSPTQIELGLEQSHMVKHLSSKKLLSLISIPAKISK